MIREGSRSETPSTSKRPRTRPLVEPMNINITPEGLRNETTLTETYPLIQLPIINEESGPRDLQEDVSGIKSVSITQISKFFSYNKNIEMTEKIYFQLLLMYIHPKENKKK